MAPASGVSLMAIRDPLRDSSFAVSHEAVRHMLARGAGGSAA
jgi:hypothetical protein